MSVHEEWSAARWYERAARCYVEKHQGCAWCGRSYCVFRSHRLDRVEFSCFFCDFFACHNHLTDRYYSSPGQTPPAAETEAMPAAGR
jgi:hypothetical protein